VTAGDITLSTLPAMMGDGQVQRAKNARTIKLVIRTRAAVFTTGDLISVAELCEEIDVVLIDLVFETDVAQVIE
jgi:hypothetical protein